MISRFFIDRPIFAAVISIVITLAGALSLRALPIAQYPPIAPPTVQVSCSYPGASAAVVADTIAAPIEQQVNGVEGMMYMSSQSGNDGSYSLIITFDLETDLNTALVMVQNRVSLAMPQLPDAVQRQGLTVKKKTPNILLAISFYSPKGRYDDIYLSNYATIHIKDELLRLDGVGDVNYLGQRDYSIRAWLDPAELAARNITASEVVRAIQDQNQAAAPGQVGQAPSPDGQAVQWPLDTLGRLQDPEQFGDIVVKSQAANGTGSPQQVLLGDIADIELGAQSYNQSATVDGHPSVALGVYQLPGTNALDVAEGVRAKMEQLKSRFPEDLEYAIHYDTTPFIRESVRDVIITLLEAIVLVGLVVLLFLQNWRATLIPLIAVPVAIVGTFAVMASLGFSLNNISLFGLVLAIGIVVDDAIVVVENVERWLEAGYTPRESAQRAMDEVTGPVIAVAVVLCAVFLPCAFITGLTGQFFRQFAVTIAVSTVISAINSLTLSPALAAILLSHRSEQRDPLSWLLNALLGWFFRLFNAVFEVATELYTKLVGWCLRWSVVGLGVYAGLLWLTYIMFNVVPVGFVPQQDQGWLLVNVQLPDSASIQRTKTVMADVEQIALKTPGVSHTLGISGMSILLSANSSNFGSMFIVLDEFEHRRDSELSANAIMARLKDELSERIREASIRVFGAPPVPGIGVAAGFKLMVEDRGSYGMRELQDATDRLVEEGGRTPGMFGVSTLFRSNTPQLFMDVDRVKARALQVPIDEMNTALQAFLGSTYVGNFNQFGRYWQVNVQAKGDFRNDVTAINQLYVRNALGEMVPLGTLVNIRDSSGPAMITRYNLYPAAAVNGGWLPSSSSGAAISTMEQISQKVLPPQMTTEWTELTYLQIKAGNTAMYVFAAAVVLVFLALAALYESWTLPLAVILVVPMCLLSSIAGVAWRYLAMNIFVQIGFVVLVGLACKNAILIVEFARSERLRGCTIFDATTEACRLRLRPILMTSAAFILGVFPMVIAKGAGAEMRWSLGTAVFSGMLGVTVFGVFLTPLFFYVIEGLGELSLFRRPLVQTIGSLLIGAGGGMLIGYLAFSAELPRWRAILLGSVILGIAAAAMVRFRPLKNRMLKQTPSGSEGPSPPLPPGLPATTDHSPRVEDPS